VSENLASASALALGLFAAPAYAQSGSASPQFLTQQPSNEWQASKLNGIAVYGSDHQQIGTISDILLNENGQAQAAVIGVGGFAGIGQRNVAVPFSALKWTNQVEGRAVSTAGGASANSANPAYPARANLNATKQQLQNAPTFRFAANMSSSSELAPPTGGTIGPAPATGGP
jgi:sporulation protein YlmC with PRC-barrel domain